MSTEFECQVIEIETGEWFYILQNWNCQVGAGDWREYATSFGPFGKQEAALDHLRETQPNPGGYQTNESASTVGDPTLARLVSEARQRRERESQLNQSRFG